MMAYMVEYGETITRKVFALSNKGKKRKGLWIIVLLCITILGYTALCYKDALLMHLLPGDAAVTASALNTLVNDVKAGHNLADAVTAFCLEIVQNAAVVQ